MASPYVGEIRLFGFNFSPRGWAFCSGATLAISQNTALFSLLGTQYGGDGRVTFQLPNLAGRAATSQGQGAGLTQRVIGETFGSSQVTLILNEMPVHSHPFVLYAQNNPAKRANAASNGNALSVPSNAAATAFLPNAAVNTSFSPGMISPFQGGGQPHSNQQPYLGMNFCIALQGIFPPRN